MSQRQSGAIRNIAEQCEELRQKINLLGESNRHLSKFKQACTLNFINKSKTSIHYFNKHSLWHVGYTTW